MNFENVFFSSEIFLVAMFLISGLCEIFRKK
jgi:hypothetical protein